MHQGNWKCSGCGGTITELPFIPRSETGLTCRACYSKAKGGSPAAPTSTATDTPFESGPDDYGDTAFASNNAVPSEKPKIAGAWQCSSCGGAITSLPFTPRDTSNLKCLDCFKRSKG